MSQEGTETGMGWIEPALQLLSQVENAEVMAVDVDSVCC
jgi:hypothetical protein